MPPFTPAHGPPVVCHLPLTASHFRYLWFPAPLEPSMSSVSLPLLSVVPGPAAAAVHWALVRNAQSQAPPQTHWTRICTFFFFYMKVCNSFILAKETGNNWNVVYPTMECQCRGYIGLHTFVSQNLPFNKILRFLKVCGFVLRIFMSIENAASVCWKFLQMSWCGNIFPSTSCPRVSLSMLLLQWACLIPGCLLTSLLHCC